jgi:hypothetical protein
MASSASPGVPGGCARPTTAACARRIATLGDPPRSAWALSRSNPSAVIPAMATRRARGPVHRVRVQRRIADAPSGADPAEQRPSAAFRHHLARRRRPRAEAS